MIGNPYRKRESENQKTVEQPQCSFIDGMVRVVYVDGFYKIERYIAETNSWLYESVFSTETSAIKQAKLILKKTKKEQENRNKPAKLIWLESPLTEEITEDFTYRKGKYYRKDGVEIG